MIIKGARVNNLKNIDVTIPRNQFVVMTEICITFVAETNEQ